MDIDWFTFIAQIINFLVLVVLLKWLLYKPIVRAMLEREQRISERLQDAETQQAKAQQILAEYQSKVADIDNQRDSLLKAAKQSAQDEQQHILHKAKVDFEHKRNQWLTAFHQEQQDLLEEFHTRAGELGIAAARHALEQLTSSDLERLMCIAFAEELKKLSHDLREAIVSNLKDADARICLRTAHELPPSLQSMLSNVVHDVFLTDVALNYERDEELLCGLELDVNGYSYRWNCNHYLICLSDAYSASSHSAKHCLDSAAS